MTPETLKEWTMLFSEHTAMALEQQAHDAQVAEDRADDDRTVLEWEQFCQEVTEFAGVYGWPAVLNATARAWQAAQQEVNGR